MKKNMAFVILIAAIVLIGGALALIGFSNSDDASTDLSTQTNLSSSTQPTNDEKKAEPEAPEPAGVSQGSTHELVMNNFSFSKQSITASPGDTVTINLTNTGGTHDFKIDELNVQSKTISSGGTDTVTFTIPPDASGSFEYYCSIGNHRALGMVGTLIIN